MALNRKDVFGYLKQYFFSLVVLIFCHSAYGDVNDEYPLRSKYPSLKIISTEQFKDIYQKGNLVVVDVRTGFEYQALHVKDSINIDVDSISFSSRLQKVRGNNPGKEIVLYCNGKTCSKSYKAGVKCKKYALNCLVYDSGITEWTKAMPNDSELFGKSPVNPDDLISDEELNAKLLVADDFIQQATKKETIVLDIRTRLEQIFSPFPIKGVSSAPVEGKRFIRKVSEAKKENKPLFIFDTGGKQIRWSMYYLLNQGVQEFYFAKGGVQALDLVLLNYDQSKSNSALVGKE